MITTGVGAMALALMAAGWFLAAWAPPGTAIHSPFHASSNAAPVGVASPSPSKKTVKPDRALYEEIARALRTRYADADILAGRNLDQAALRGMLASMGNSARLVDAQKEFAGAGTENGPSLTAAAMVDPYIGYLRLARVDLPVVRATQEGLQKMMKDPRLQGLVLDLRFANGSRYDAASALAGFFLGASKTVFNIRTGGSNQVFTTPPTPVVLGSPMVVLVNGQTRQAAEVLAAVLQDQSRAVLIGSAPTAGEAFLTSDVSLSNGQVLRLATGKISLPKRGDLFLKPTAPDITAALDPQVEAEIHRQPFRPPEVRMGPRFYSEAILTGRELSPPITKDKKGEEQDLPSNHDGVLLRALDLIKSIRALGISEGKAAAPATDG